MYAYVTECVHVLSSAAMHLVLIELYKVKYLHKYVNILKMLEGLLIMCDLDFNRSHVF